MNIADWSAIDTDNLKTQAKFLVLAFIQCINTKYVSNGNKIN